MVLGTSEGVCDCQNDTPIKTHLGSFHCLGSVPKIMHNNTHMLPSYQWTLIGADRSRNVLWFGSVFVDILGVLAAVCCLRRCEIWGIGSKHVSLLPLPLRPELLKL